MIKIPLAQAVLVLSVAGPAVSRGDVVTLTDEKTTMSAPAVTSGTSGSASLSGNGKTAIVRIPVDGMSCAVCVARTRKALQGVEGVDDVTVSLAEREARVRFQPGKVNPDQLLRTINDLGYRAGAPVTTEKE